MAAFEPTPKEVADAFHRDGYVVLRDVLSQAFVATALERAEQNFLECRATITSKRLHFGLHAKAGFREIVERNPGRFEVPYRMDEPGPDNPFASRAELLENPRLIAVLDAILGDAAPSAASSESKSGGYGSAAAVAAEDAAIETPGASSTDSAAVEEEFAQIEGETGSGSGGGDGSAGRGGGDWSGGGMPEPTGNGWRLLGRSVVMALPGAEEQQWHVDGAHVDVAAHRPCHVLNVFFPLVDITRENGPTEVRTQQLHVYNLPYLIIASHFSPSLLFLRPPAYPPFPTSNPTRA